MKDYLIFLTASFPYGKGETFIENEIEFLSENFSKVYIIPVKGGGIHNQRKIPSNCIVDTTIRDKKRKETKIERFFSKLISPFKFQPFLKDLLIVFPKKLSVTTISKLFTHTRDAIWARNTISKIINDKNVKEKQGIIYTYWLDGSTAGAVSITSQLKVVSRVHRADLYEELYSKNYIPYRTYTASRIDSIFSISDHGSRYLLAKYGDLTKSIKLSRLGIKFPTKAKFNPDSRFQKVIVSCSSINTNKRVIEIAQVLKKFTLSNPELDLVWNHFGDGHLMAELKLEIQKFPSNLKAILHGHIENQQLIEWYSNNSVDLFLNLSKSEGIPVSIMEASSFGIPTIATNVGGTSEIVFEESGWLIDRNFTETDVLDALNQALLSDSVRSKKGIQARKISNTLFNAKKNYSNFCEELNSL